MGKLNQFSILFASPTGVFFGGQVIEGQVLLDFSEPMKMRGIRLRFQGTARVHWSEQHKTGSGKNRRTVTRHYSSSENYFDHILVLYGKAPGVDGDNPVHPAGQFSYPFQFQVPPGAPSSFEAVTGRVRYTIEGRIDKPWKFDHTTKAAFTVINLLDLNREPLALSCPQGQNSKTLCCLCCKSGPIEAVCRLDRMGFVPGDFITINAEITNGSSRKMSRSFAQLIQVITFHATTKSKSSVRVIAHKDYPEILPGHSDTWAGERLHIPPVPPSRLDGCRIIDIKYVLKFCVDPSGPGFDLEVPLEVLIGSIPHQQVLQRLGQFPPSGAAAPAMPGPAPPGAVPAGYMPPPNYNSMGQPPPLAQPSAPLPPPDMPPPSYAECEFSRVNIREEGDTDFTKGNLDFAPKYTYYDWGNNGNK